MRFIILYVLFLLVNPFIYAQSAVHADTGKSRFKIPVAYNYSAKNPYFPFILSLTSLEYDVTVNLADKKIIEIYQPIFKRNNLLFSPESWEEIIMGLWDDDSLMHHQITTSAEGSILRIGTGGKEYQQTFINYVMPLFNDTIKLEAFLKRNTQEE